MHDLFEYLLLQKLEKKINAPVELKITDNVRSMLYIKPRGRGFVIRLHHMFLDADEKTLDDIARYAVSGRSYHIQKYIDSHSDRIADPDAGRPRRKIRIRTRGTCHDLSELFREVNDGEFGGQVDCRITWGRRSRGRNTRSIMFGSYSSEEKLIRIHARMDRRDVPRFFVKYIVFHEMLHAVEKGGRGYHHTRAFKKREKAYYDYTRAVQWQKKHLGLFIR
ncbi:hypothetical protein ACFL4W_03700 [Planctomycetota bacterium]